MKDNEYVSKKKLFEMMCFYNVYPQDMSQLEFVDKLPNADVQEVKHGEWVDDSDDVYWGTYIVKKHCSECGYTPKFDRETGLFNLTKRCPECGAEMDGGKE